MKIRTGFVSNSSSSSFILDIRDKGVLELVNKMTTKKPCDVNRLTAVAKGKDAVEYAKQWNNDVGEHHLKPTYGDWILEWSEKLGEDNIVFVRESDEGMGGYLFKGDKDGEDLYDDGPLHQKLSKLSKSYMEYH